jgi:hypothetical protein
MAGISFQADSNILDRRRAVGLVQREIVVIGPVARVAGFLDEVDRGEDHDEDGDDQPENVVGGDAAGATPFEIDEEPAGEDGKNRPEFSQECFQSGLMNRRGEGPESEIGTRRRVIRAVAFSFGPGVVGLSAEYWDLTSWGDVCLRDAGVKVCAV